MLPPYGSLALAVSGIGLSSKLLEGDMVLSSMICSASDLISSDGDGDGDDDGDGDRDDDGDGIPCFSIIFSHI